MQTARTQDYDAKVDTGPEHAEDGAIRAFGDHHPPAFLNHPDDRGSHRYSSAFNSESNFSSEGGAAEARDDLAHGTRRAGMSKFIFQEQNIQMGKRSARNKKQFHENQDSFQLHAIPGGWDPIEERRDQSFIRHVKPHSDAQRQLMEAIESTALTLAIGPAGTGKTYLAIAAAVKALEESRIDRIVLSRPAIEAGEALGYLPGTMEEKMSPYLRPLYDALSDRLGGKRLRQYVSDGTIEIAPIAYMRGRTLNNAFVVIDEAQNCTYGQIKMLLTRLGWHSTMVITGDPDQSDLLPGVSGLADIANRLSAIPDIAVVRLSKLDVVRHPLVACMLAAL
jgi:phosphate starvation-inducible PhoH-like protein